MTLLPDILIIIFIELTLGNSTLKQADGSILIKIKGVLLVNEVWDEFNQLLKYAR